MPAGSVHEPGGVEDLVRLMCVEGGHDLGDRGEIAVDELAEAAAVGRRAGDEQLEAGRAERVLAVDDHEPDAGRVVCRRREHVLDRPPLGLGRPVLVRNAPDISGARRVEVRRDRQLRERHPSESRSRLFTDR
jgi:hypothetical protein